MNHDAPPNPKKFRLQPGDTVGKTDGGSRVLVTWPDTPSSSEEELLAGLKDAGVVFPDDNRALTIIGQTFDESGIAVAAEAWRVFYERLPGGRRGAELRAAMLSSISEENMSEQAAQLGVTRQTWHRVVTRLRARLLKNG